MNFGLLLLRGSKFFEGGYLAHFLLERDEIWQYLGLWPVDTEYLESGGQSDIIW